LKTANEALAAILLFAFQPIGRRSPEHKS